MAALLASGAVAASAAAIEARPAQLTFGFERWQLPANEALGALGMSYAVELAPGWRLGPALYGAATGRRGGLFTWGLEGQRHWRLAERWDLVAGLYVGGGGGAAAPVGSGLMLRPHVDLLADLGGWQAGLSASRVDFPDGAIGSTQLGLLVSLPDRFVFASAGRHGRTVAFDDASPIRADRVSLTTGHHAQGEGGEQAFGQVGIRLDHAVGPGLWATAEAAGAARGGADGYAEMLVGALALWPAGDPMLRVGGRAALGLGGGGGVPAGGGLIAKLALAAELDLGAPWVLGLEAGQAAATSGAWRSPYAQLALGARLGAAGPGAVLHEVEWALSVQHYGRAQRKQGRAGALDTIGLRFSRSLSDRLYLTGQAHGAVTGGAGAYSAGLVGLGVTTRLADDGAWRGGAEALVGAAGGGGVANGGGALLQPMVWLARELGPHQRLRVGVGYLKSLRGELSTPVAELSWGLAFGRP
ncbi:hypothetical protein [Ideonella sp.]|uniref:hypothetical protein n=1 Tax=Ideonella sp. TaxID=1929293 RepID=UPI002B463508|nr:hypothetical protein [Ideonella sp.]HJV68419.1 hypothetical protein [Ideonella sp.]